MPAKRRWSNAVTSAALTLASWLSSSKFRRQPLRVIGKPRKRGWRRESGKGTERRSIAARTIMDRARWEQIQSIFHEVLDHSASEQSDILTKLCQDDESLISDVARMLKEVESGDSVLDYDFPRLAQVLMDDSAAVASSAIFGPYRLKELLGEG